MTEPRPEDDARQTPEEASPGAPFAADAASAPPTQEREVTAADFDDDVWVDEPAGPSLITRMIAEAGGSFVFILIALGAAIFADGRIVVAFGFALALWGVIVAIGGVSGAHVNPAVTVGAWIAGRFPGRDVAPYVLAQTLGATGAGATLWALIGSNPQVQDAKTIMSAVAIGVGENSPTQFPLAAGAVVEVLATGMFVAVVLAATSIRAIPALAAPTIGLALGVLHLFAIPFTNAALNPARATGAALFAETWALEQLWLFWLAPIIGGAIVGLLFRAFGPEEDIERVEVIEVIDEIEA
ncbi:aquaporin [Demequina pelophila]|uniref:aquaporin n=1 Tax=Demequina pelophila TaxID=1638984 RepID=UPI0007819370|nr:aquaporin [Demequina pelophila]